MVKGLGQRCQFLKWVGSIGAKAFTLTFTFAQTGFLTFTDRPVNLDKWRRQDGIRLKGNGFRD